MEDRTIEGIRACLPYATHGADFEQLEIVLSEAIDREFARSEELLRAALLARSTGRRAIESYQSSANR